MPWEAGVEQFANPTFLKGVNELEFLARVEVGPARRVDLAAPAVVAIPRPEFFISALALSLVATGLMY